MDFHIPCLDRGATQPKICKICAGPNFIGAISDNGDFHVWGKIILQTWKTYDTK